MPHASKTILLFIASVWLSNTAVAKADPECLKHLGGGDGDTLCYGEQATDLAKNNQVIYVTVRAKIPAGNPHAKLLDAYMSAQDDALKFCDLQRDVGTGWTRSPDGSMYLALYAACVYNVRKSQNGFLTGLLDMTKW